MLALLLRTYLLHRFGFGKDGKPLESRTCVQRGFRQIYPNGDSIVGGVLYSASQSGDAIAAADAAAAKEEEEIQKFADESDDVSRGKLDFATVAERFTAKHRREHRKVNSYNLIIAFCTRSNMDIKALLRDSDARGALFYILNYSTKTETTMDALLNVLAPVVERIKDEAEGAPAAVTAAQLVRACSCKTVAHMPVGAPAAASKVLGYTDAKSAPDARTCPMKPLLALASASFDALPPAEGSNDNADDEDDGDDDDDGDDYHSGAILNTSGGKIRISISLHELYLRRCLPNDTEHPYHGMCYAVWARLVRIENTPRKQKPARRPNDDNDRESGDSDDTCDTPPPSPPAATRKRGRPLAKRHDFVGLPTVHKQQVILPCCVTST